MSTRHTLSVLVENKPGVLTRVAALFARRAFNIHSLAVGETEDPRISRMTVVVDAAELPIEQDALSLTSTTPSTAERVSDENVDGETTLHQSADTPQADASGDTSASAIRTDEPRGTERHSTAFSLPSAEELPAWLESFTKVFEADEQPAMWTGLCSHPEFRASFQRLPEQQRHRPEPLRRPS